MNSNIQNLIHRAVNNHDFSKTCGNVSVSQGDIYSYNLLIASLVNGVWVLYGDTWSATTTRHQAYVRYAIRGATLDVGEVPRYKTSLQTHVENLKRYKHKYDAAIEKLAKAKSKKQDYIDLANCWVNEQANYIDVYGEYITTDKIPKLLTVNVETMPHLVSEAKERNAVQAAENKARAAKRAARNKEQLDMWLSGSDEEVYYNLPSSPYDYWRVRGDYVESTRGVTLSKEDARKAYQLLKSGLAASGSRIANHYQVKRVTGTEAVVGCHVMLISHLDDVAAQLGE
jgi:hypothetical protein